MRLTVLHGENVGAPELENSMDTFARVLYDGKEVGVTHVVKKSINPAWDLDMHFPLVESWDMSAAFVVFELHRNDDNSHSTTSKNPRELNANFCKDQYSRRITAPQRTFSPFICSHPPRLASVCHCIVPSNEKILYLVEEVSLTFHVTEANQGVLALMVLTTFRLWFVPYTPVHGLDHEDVHTIPIGKIAKLTQTQTKQKENTVHGLAIENMDAGLYSVTMNARLRDGDSEVKRIRTLAHVVEEIEWLQLENNFCAFTDLNVVESHPEANVITEHPVGMSPLVPFSFIDTTTNGHHNEVAPAFATAIDIIKPQQSLLSPTNGVNKRRIRYDPLAEFTRRLQSPGLEANNASIGDDILAEAARFRSKKRVPVLTWIHPRAALCRSSQPKSGVLRTTSKEDRDLLWAIRDAAYPAFGKAKASTLVHIVDCRPEINAKSNALAGKGHESARHYERDGNASIAFMGIDNIHVVRSSFAQLSQALYQVDDTTFHSTLQKSRWLEHINSILVGATEVASHLERGDAVLVHCSDGWDRTSQLCALAQTMLDPYFRTIEGFAILVEKDWSSFGHQFAKRCSFPVSDETSPVFQQFLDAVYQLTLQFPTHFQFNELFLSTIADAVYSSWYGTFQKNCEQEREAFLRDVPTISIWDTIRASTDMYRNPLYDSDTDEAMRPACRVRLMQLWTSQHQKAISHMRLQQREIEMLALIRQQEQDLARLRDLLTPEQHLEMKISQLRSEIHRLSRDIAIHHELLLPLSLSTQSTPNTTPNKQKLLRRLTTVVSPSNAPVNAVATSAAHSHPPLESLRGRNGSLRQGLTALLTGKTPSDLATLRAEYQDLTRQLEDLRAIARALDEKAHTAILRFQNFTSPLEEVKVEPEFVKDEASLLFSPATHVGSSSVVSATLSNSFSSVMRHINLLAMTEFHHRHSVGKINGSRSSSVARSNTNTQPVWESDKDAACCKQCKKKFIAVVRNRHHCRCCGYIFCAKCTNHRMELPEFGYFDLVRVCRACFNSGDGEDPAATPVE
ncbi:hypothetical protein Ae201684P_011171 [Aphanomyces euteiches]|nr:hypothetical protein Ae201684P_011171 [Aphanomyces euteiches]